MSAVLFVVSGTQMKLKQPLKNVELVGPRKPSPNGHRHITKSGVVAINK